MRRNDTQYSKFWMGDADFDVDPKNVDMWDAESLIKFASFKRAIANFVRIVTGKPIPVVYNTGSQSFTSGKMVVLSAKLEHNQFDTAVGVALHEGTHCAITDFKVHAYMQTYQTTLAKMVIDNVPLSNLRSMIYSEFFRGDGEDTKYVEMLLSMDPKPLVRVMKRLMVLHDIKTSGMLSSITWDYTKWFENWVEDRRIDFWQAKNSPGYRGYYNAMYETYFYTKLVGRGVKAKNYARTETWESYRFRVTNILHPHTDLTALKGLAEIWNIIDIAHVARWESSLDSWKTSFSIVDVICKYLEKEKTSDEKSRPSPKTSDDSEKRSVADSHYEDEVNEDDEPSDESGSKGGSASDDNSTGDDNFDQKPPSSMDGEKGKIPAPDEDGDESDDEDIDGGSGDGDKSDDEDGEDGSSKSGDSSDDDASDDDNLTPAQKAKMDKEEDKQKKFLDGDISKKKMDKKLKSALDAVESSGVTLEGVGSGMLDAKGNPVKVQCVVIRNVTKELIESNAFPDMFSQYGSWRDQATDRQKFVEEGFRLGTLLGKRLQIRNESRTTRYSRLETGRIDKRLLASLGYQNDRVFYRTMVDKYNPLMLHISVDASASMQGTKWNQTLTSVVAIIKAASMTKNLNVVVSVRGTTSGPRGDKRTRRRRSRYSTTYTSGGYDINTRPLVAIVYDSRVDKLNKVMSLFKFIYANGNTPEGLAFEPIIDEMVAGKDSEMESIFLNISDGQPCFYADVNTGEYAAGFSYGGEVGAKHTASMVQKMRSLNIKILAYIIQDGRYREDSDWDIFKLCYGKDSRKINMTNIVDLARTLNEKFLEKKN